MVKKKKKKNRRKPGQMTITQADIEAGVRKPTPPPSRKHGGRRHPSKVHPAKKGLDG